MSETRDNTGECTRQKDKQVERVELEHAHHATSIQYRRKDISVMKGKVGAR